MLLMRLNTLLNEPDAQPIEPQSSGFTSLANVINGNMEYHFQDGDTKIPVSFLNELKTLSVSSTTVPPTSTSSLVVISETTPSIISSSAVVTTRLVFNSSSPVPSESLVLNATRNLLSSRFTNITNSVKVLNVTYEKITDTSYAVIFTFTLTNISMPDNKTLVNNTYSQVQNTINKVLNTLLNEPDAQPIEPQSSGFTSLANVIKGNMEYHFQDGDTKIPVSFLNELKTLSVSSTTVPPTSTSSLVVISETTPSIISSSAVVTTRLVFNSSSPVPSESLVLNATRNLLSSRFTNITDSVKVLNVTYEKITDTSYAVIFTFTLTNISMPDNKTLVNNTYSQVQNTINKVLNTLLNEPDAQPIEPQSSGFTSLANVIKGNMEYHFQDGDTKIPVSFLNELKTLSVSSTTVPPTSTSSLVVISETTPSIISSSAVVTTRLVFNSSSPVPSESLVLNATRNLLSSRFTNITDSVKVLNVTYEKITDTSYAVIFTFTLTNISMPDNKTLVNNTYSQLNTLLNEPDAQPIEPQSSGFTSLANVINGNMEYHFQDGDTKIPVSFLNELKTLSVSSTTVPPTSTSSLVVISETTPSIISSSAVVTTRLVFNSSSPVPSESLVLNATRNLLSSRFTNITNSVKVLNVTYEKITDTSYAVIFTFTLTNISMPDNKTLVNNTYSQLNTLLNEPDAQPIEPQSSGFTSLANVIKGNMEYHFQDGDTKIPVSFLNELKTLSVSSTTVPPTSTSSLVVISETTPSIISSSAVVTTRLVFNSSSPVPSESLVLNATRNLLSSRFTNITDSVKVLNVTYEKITDTSYAVIFTFTLTNISMPDNKTLVNNTYSQVQNTINKVLNTLLNEPDAQPIEPQSSGFTSLANVIKGNMEYHFQDGDTKIPVSFLNELKTLSVSSTTVPPTSTISLVVTSETTPSIKSGSAVVTTRLLFNSSSPVPSESLVLNATRNLLSSRFTNITDSVKVLSVTYEKISDTSYAVIFSFSLSNIRIPNSPELRNSTYSQVQSSVNNALNSLINGPNSESLEPQIIHFKSSSNQIEGNIVYQFQDGDARPVNYLTELRRQNGMTTTTTTTSIANTPLEDTNTLGTSTATQSVKTPTQLGIVLIYISLVFKNLTIVPSEAQILAAANAYLDTSLIRTKRDITMQKLNTPVSIQNITYKKINSTAFSISFAFRINDVPMATNETNVSINNVIKDVVNKIMNSPNATQFELKPANFRLGTALIYISVVFKNVTHIPSETEFLTAFALLNSSVTRTASKNQKLNNPVSIQNSVSLYKIDSTSFTISFGYMISYVPISTNDQLNIETHNATVIVANAEYVYMLGDINFPSSFLAEILKISGLAPESAWPPSLRYLIIASLSVLF
ncbi:hypothetical protein P4O66_002051 [Electrophorus voltai]|uniref:Uncharacterized protein n=1 Tax=Electrophorus voltai TaxID=2609070 RepID=A0AAD8Z473_9TELE|nr:hypothetical protein P4O66_002051 [Electrophorus voltai]